MVDSNMQSTEIPSSSQQQVKRAGTFEVSRWGGKKEDAGWLGYAMSVVTPSLWLMGLAVAAIAWHAWAQGAQARMVHSSGFATPNWSGSLGTVTADATNFALVAAIGTRTSSPVSTSMVYTEAPVSTAVPVAGSVTLVPTRTATAVYVPASMRSKAYYSWYWPPLGGVNCRGDCVHMASGLAWRDWVGRAVACPASWPFGTVVLFQGSKWYCLDRGSAIVTEANGVSWLDFLLPNGAAKYGSEVDVDLEEGNGIPSS